MVFGVFDGLHEGHKFFLREAKKLGTKLVIVVAEDEVGRTIKNKTPKFTLQERISALEQFDPTLEVIAGDKEMGSWLVFKNNNPEIIALGYDQKKLAAALEEYFKNSNIQPKLVRIPGFKTDVYKTSLIQKQNG